MDIEYRITLANGETYYLTVHVRLSANLGRSDAHTQALNDGLIIAAVTAQHAEWWPVNGEFAEIKFWQVHPF